MLNLGSSGGSETKAVVEQSMECRMRSCDHSAQHRKTQLSLKP